MAVQLNKSIFVEEVFDLFIFENTSNNYLDLPKGN